MPANYPPSVPRLKAVPMELDPELLIGISEKGGISVYGLQRFPITLYYEQWQRILPADHEILTFAESHQDLLGAKETKVAKDVEDRTFSINASEVALAAAEADRLTKAGDMPGAVKFNTIKAVAEANKGKVTFEQLTEIMQLKARK